MPWITDAVHGNYWIPDPPEAPPPPPADNTPTPEPAPAPTNPPPVPIPVSLPPPPDTTTLSDGSRVSTAELDKLPPAVKQAYISEGVDAGDKALDEYKETARQQYRYEKKQAQFESEDMDRLAETQQSALRKLEAYKTGDGSNRHPYAYDIAGYLKEAKSPGEALQTLKEAGFGYDTVKDAAMGNVKQAQAEAQAVKDKYSAGGIAKYSGNLVAEIVVPGYYTAKNWKDLKGWERAVSIGVDVLTLLPVVPAAAAGAREVSTAGRAARLGGAAKGIGREAVAQLRAPVDTVLHPIATVKGAVRNVRETGENLLHPRKLPEAVLTTSNNTVRLRVTEATSPARAKEISDTMMKLAGKGEKPIVEVDGIKYELSTSPLMKELKGGLAHATPQGEAFEKGAIVQLKANMPAREQGLFMSHEPLPRFATSSAHGSGGTKPAIIITSPDTAEKAISSAKLYPSPNPSQGLVAEMERKFPVGFKLPEPKQKLFTRVGPERTQVALYLEKPLSKLQIAKLKAMGLAEDIKAPFKPAITISGDMKTLDRQGIRKLAKVLDESGNTDIARTLRRSERDILRVGERTGGYAGRVARTGERARVGERTVRTEGTGRRAPPVPGSYRRIAGRTEDIRSGAPRVGPDRQRVERTEPPRNEPPRPEPARVEPGRVEPGRVEPGRTEPPRVESPRTEPPRIEPGRPKPPRIPEPHAGKGRPPHKEEPPKLSLGVGQPPAVHTAEDYANATTWKQGLGWWIVFPDNTTEFSRHRPEGVKEVPGPDKNKPGSTIQVYKPRGEIRVKTVTGDMGIQDIRIGRQGKRPVSIAFRPDPLRSTHNPVQFGKPKAQFKSRKVGRVYHTRIGRGVLLSREPLR